MLIRKFTYLYVSHIESKNDIDQASFPSGTPGNGVPKIILTVATAFKPALGELYKRHPVCTKIRLFEIQNRKFFHPTSLGPSAPRPPFANPGAPTVWFPHFFFAETIPDIDVFKII